MVGDANTDASQQKAKSRFQVANEYGISVRTLNRWFRKAGLFIPNGLLDPFHLNIIYRKFGDPKKVKET